MIKPKKTRLNAEIKKRLKEDTAFKEALCFHLTVAPRTVEEWLRVDFKKKLDSPSVVEFCEKYIARNPKPIEQEA